MSLPLLLSLATLAGPAPQQARPEGPAATRASAAGSWDLVNQIYIIVNEDVLTLRQLENRLQRALEVQPVSNPGEMQALRSDIATRAVQDLLMVQRGRDLGFDPEYVQRTVSNYLREQADTAGGVSSLAERLALEGDTAARRRETITDELYAISYERAITGQAPGPGGRPSRDRYVRPGLLALAYEQIELQPTAVRALGGDPETFVLQQLVLSAATFGGPEPAREFAEDLRRQALEGADFEDLVLTYSVVTTERGLSPPLTVPDLRRAAPEALEFCLAAEEGDLSPVLPILEKGVPVYYRVLRVHQRRPLSLPPFTAAEVQQRLSQIVLRNRDGMLRDETLRRLFASSYIWTPENVRPPQREMGP